MNVAVIPARGGSKRIPRKNIKPFCGKPMIAYSIESAKASELFDKVLVSTDDTKIAEIAKDFGAEVPFIRPAKLSDDHTGTDEVFIHALNYLINNDKNYRNACCIYPAVPLLKVSLLSEGLDRLRANNATSCFPVLEFCSPIDRALEINKKGRLGMIIPKYKSIRTQDLQSAYHDAGQFYWVNIEKYLKVKSILCNNSVPIVLPKYEVVDIDSDEDWKFAESLYSIRTKGNLSSKKK